ncbi:helix-turn-helix transcriptional regulator [Propionibacteriaceae bacterium Y1923]
MSAGNPGGQSAPHALGVLSSPVRRDILDVLANLPRVPTGSESFTRTRGLTAAELGQRLDLHVTTVRFHVDQLVEVGLVSCHDERGQVGRPKRRYTASPGLLPDVQRTESYQRLEEMLSSALQTEGDLATAEEAGRFWLATHAADILNAPTQEPAHNRSEWFAKIGQLVDVLDEWGYAPELATLNAGHTAELQLHNCPLRDLVDTQPDVACGVHRGIIQGTLEAIGEGDAELRLTPMAAPDVCLARITTRHNLTQHRTTPEKPASPEKGQSS